MKKAERLFLLLALILAIAGISIACRPLVQRAETEHEVEKAIVSFYEYLAEEEPEAAEEMPFAELRALMQEYNEQLYLTGQAALASKQAYETPPFLLTEYGLSNNVFGVICIPAMDVELPLYLGADSENMANGAAVLGQTSIPIGGINTNAVIAGHRGWGGYPYFLNIDKLRVGDQVRITNLWEELRYTVVEIQIIEPYDVDAILIQPGRELLTLMTCHPYASGGRYRYLVFCERNA